MNVCLDPLYVPIVAVLVDQEDKQRGLGLAVQDINTGPGIEQHLVTLIVTGYKTPDKMRVM